MGHSDNLKLGDWNALCDRCGFKFKASELKEEWTGWMVCKECWEPRHPQDFIKGIPDDSSVPWSRPDSEDKAYNSLLDNGILGWNVIEGTDDIIQVWDEVTTTTYRISLFDAASTKVGARFIIYQPLTQTLDMEIQDHTTTIHTTPAGIKERVDVEWNGSAWKVVNVTPLGL